MSQSFKAYSCVLAQSVIIGLSFLFVKIALNSADPMVLLAHRFTVAAIGAVAIQLVFRSSTQPFQMSTLKLLPLFAAYPFAFFTFQTLALERLSSSEAGIIQALVPILTVIMARLILKERISTIQTFFVCLSVFGVFGVQWFNASSAVSFSLAGSGFALLSITSIALYNILIKKVSQHFNIVGITVYASLTGCICFNGLALLSCLRAGSMSSYLAPLSSASYLWSIMYLGLLSSLLTTVLLTYGLKYLKAGTVGLFSNVATLITLLAGVLILKEPLRIYHWVGIITILGGTIGYNMYQTKKLPT